jgi:ribosomal protein S18 acetylase RimI-like enzyme
MEVSALSIDISKMVIRKAGEKDLPAMEWDGEYSHFRKLFQSLYQSSLKGETILWLVELPEVGLVGQIFVQLICSRPELADGISRAYLFSFRIKSGFRKSGIGAKLLEFVENDLRSHGYHWSVLNVDQNNYSARRFYEKYGYVVVGVENGNWSYIDQYGKHREIHEPAWRMEKRLLK